MSENKRINWIDYYKGIAIVGILLVHCGGGFRSLGIIGERICDFGKCGVEIFLILSSYMAFTSYARIDNRRYGKTINWIANKIFRLMPLFYLFLFIYLYQNHFMGSGWLGDRADFGITKDNIFATMMFINIINPYWFNSCMGINWYIAILVPLLCFVPIMSLLIKNEQKAYITAAISFVLSLCLYVLLKNMAFISDISLWKTWLSLILQSIFVFMLGIILFYSQITCEKIVWLTKGFLALMILCGWTSEMYFIEIIAMLFLIILLNAKNQKRKYYSRTIMFLGKYSYGIYLSHMCIFIFLSKFVVNQLFLFIITLISASAISIICTKYIEKPLMYFKEKWSVNTHS